jgi:hypothetical protein
MKFEATTGNFTMNEIDNLFSPPRMLLGESAERFATLRAELTLEIKPKGIIEEIYVNDLAEIVWDISRFRRFKTDIILSARAAAVHTIIKQFYNKENNMPDELKVKKLMLAWFENTADKTKVEELLRKFQLDEGAIDAEAYRSVFPQLQDVEKMLALAEDRFSKTVHRIAGYRKSFAQVAEMGATRILAKNDVPRAEPANDEAAA